MVNLSILIPSLPERIGFLGPLLAEFQKQSNGEVEILSLIDNRQRTTGQKRNDLISLAKGKYIVFFDDDDRVSMDYVSSILESLQDDPDCVVFDVQVNLNGNPSMSCKYGIEYEHGNSHDHYYRKPNHLMVYRKSIAEKHKYKDISFGEDDDWGQRACLDIKKQNRINKILYHYDYLDKPSNWYT